MLTVCSSKRRLLAALYYVEDENDILAVARWFQMIVRSCAAALWWWRRCRPRGEKVSFGVLNAQFHCPRRILVVPHYLGIRIPTCSTVHGIDDRFFIKQELAVEFDFGLQQCRISRPGSL
jgi:hypothetical protein